MVRKTISLASPPGVLELEPGDICRLEIYFDYMGPVLSGATIYAAIGNRGWAGFDEVVKGQASLSPIPETPTKKTYGIYVDIPITTAISPGTGYDLYVKLINIPGPDLFAYVNDVISIVAAPATRYTLAIDIEPPWVGRVIISAPEATYSEGKLIILTAVPFAGYVFDHWGGWPPYPGIQSTSPTLELVMTADWWVVAAFRAYVPPPPPPPPPPPEPEPEPETRSYWYHVVFTDGSRRDVPVPYDPGAHISLWDIVDRDTVASFTYLGFY